MSKFYFPVLSLCCMLWTQAAPASTIFSDFGPSNTYNAGTGLGVSGPFVFSGERADRGSRFTPASDAFLTSITVGTAMETPAGGTKSIVLSLDSDQNGVPGQALETWTLDNLPFVFPCCQVQTVVASKTISLVAGTQYWLVAAPGGADTWAFWGANSQGVMGQVAANSNGSAFFTFTDTLPAFDVEGQSQAVPEPSTMVTLAICICGLLIRNRRGTNRSTF